MSVDVIEQVRRLVESFEEFVDDLSTEEIGRPLGGTSDSDGATHPTPPPPNLEDQSGRRRFGLAAAAAVLVAGLVGALLLVNADRSTPPATVPSSFSTADVDGTWIVTRQERQVDDAGSKGFVPLASPLPTYTFDNDGTLSAFDGCNSIVASWSFTDGEFAVTDVTTAAAPTSCEDSDGTAAPIVEPPPTRLESIHGTTNMVFIDQDRITAHAQRLSDLPTPQRLAGSSWILAVDGPDVSVQFGRDGTIEFREDTMTCATGLYTYDAGVLVLHLDPAIDECSDAPLDELSASPLIVAYFSDAYVADTILLVPETGGAVRLFPASGFSRDTATASTVVTVADS